MNKKMLIIIMTLTFSILFAQYDEKKIMFNQAQSFENMNQLTRAQQIYKDLLKKYPQDQEVVQKLFYNYIRVSDLQNASILLEDKKPILNQTFYTQSKILLLCKDNRISEAISLADSFISENPNLINNYQSIASTFEQNNLFEIAAKYYKQARKISHNETIFALELSNTYYQLQDYQATIKESVVLIIQNKAYVYYVTSRFKEIVNRDSLMIDEIQRNCEHNDTEEVRELYALSLVELKQYQKALSIYDNLNTEKFIRFCDELYANSLLDYALQGYEMILKKVNQPILIGDMKLKMAKVYLSRKDINSAKNYLNQIISMNELTNQQNLYKTKVHRESREIMASVLIMDNADKDKVLSAFNDAEKYIFNQNDKKNIAFKKVHYLSMKEEYTEAEKLLDNTLKGEEYGSVIIAKSLYFRYELYLMKNDVKVDSMMTEYILFSPEDNAINDMLFLSLFVKNLPKEKQNTFLKAYRYKQLYQDSLATSLLQTILDDFQNDELKLLLAEWYISDLKYDKALVLYNGKFDNEVYQEFAKLEAVKIETEKEFRRNQITDYLKNTPNSVFSPLFRQLLVKKIM